MDTRGSVHHAGRHRHHGHPRPIRHSLSWPVACWVFVLLAIGVVQIVRVQWFDAAVFFAAGFAVAADALRAPRTSHRETTGHSADSEHGSDMRPAEPAIGVLWLSIIAGIGGATMCFLPRHGTAMKVVVIAIGVAATGLAWRGRIVAHPQRTTALTRGVIHLALAWAAIVVAGCIWELVQFILGLVQPQAAWFSLSDLLNPTVATVPGRVLFIIAWVAFGVWLLRRGGRR